MKNFIKFLSIHFVLMCFSQSAFSATALIDLEPIEKEVPAKSIPKSKDGNIILNKHDFWVNFFKKEVGGKLTFLPFFGGKTESVSLLAQKDYVHYRTEGDKK